MKAGKEIDLFPDSYRGDPIRPVRYRWPPKQVGQEAPVAPVGDPPVLSTLSPGQSAQSSVVVDVRGSNFTTNSVVVFNNVQIATTFVSNTRLTATFIRTGAGTYDVKVRDVGGDSNVKQFTFN